MDNAALLSALGIWLGFLLSLMAFSAILGDHLLARLAQHLLVGAALGYLLVLVIQNILRPQLVEPLLAGGDERTSALVPLILSLLLLGAGGAAMVRSRRNSAGGSGSQVVRRVGLIPIVVLLGVGLATAAVGAVQGTVLPLAAQTAAWRVGNAVLGLLMLLVTTGVLLHLYVEPAPHTFGSTQVPGGRILQRLLSVWTWLGQRMLWLAAGFIFARLVAARLSLLIARFEYFFHTLQETSAWRVIASILPGFGS